MGLIEQLFPFDSASEAQTMDLGERIGELLGPGAVVALVGDLGAGKTHLVKGIARAFGVSQTEVSSPTFTIAHEYRIHPPAATTETVVDLEFGAQKATASHQKNTAAAHQFVPEKHGKLLYHLDLYRLNSESDLFGAGIEEYLQSGEICLIEWPEKAGYLLPESTHVLRLRHQPNGSRRIEYVKTITR